MKILHCADLHLDSRLETNLKADKAKKRRNEILNKFAELVEYANEKNAGIIALTDSPDSPSRMYSHILLCARTEEVAIAQSMAAPMSLATSLVAEVFSQNRDFAMQNIAGIEKVYSDFDIEGIGDLEQVNTNKIYNYPEINFHE